MATAKDAKIQYEAGQTAYAMVALSASGAVYSGSASPWSQRSGYAPEIRPDGLISGGRITPHSVADYVSVAGGTAYIAGQLVNITAANVECPRPTLQNCNTDQDCTHIIYSITLDTDGVVAAAPGTQGLAFGTRNGVGGAPYIAENKIELGQVWLSSRTSGLISESEIHQVPGTHQERFDVPLMLSVDYYAGSVTFASEFPLIHAAGTKKKVWASYAVPQFADVPKGTDFKAPETTYSVGSVQYYGGAEGTVSSSLGQGSFTAILNNGVTDPLIQLKGETLWFRFYPDKARTPHIACQGVLGVTREFPVADAIKASCTISSQDEGQEIM